MDTSRYPTPDSLLHLLAALLPVEKDAGCHKDGTADGERLADEARAVAGLGEVAGLGGLRAGEMLRAVCHLLLCGLLCLLSCDLIGKLQPDYDAALAAYEQAKSDRIAAEQELSDEIARKEAKSMAQSNDKPMTKRMMLTLPTVLYSKLDKISREIGISKSAYVILALQEYIANHEDQYRQI